MMTVKSLLDIMLHTRNVTQKELAEQFGCTPQWFSQKRNTGNMQVRELVRIMDLLEFDIHAVDRLAGNDEKTNATEKKTEEERRKKRGGSAKVADMTIRTLLDAMLHTRGVSQNTLCKKLGCTQQSFSRKVTTGTLRVPDLIRVADMLDFDIQFTDRRTGKVAHARIYGFGRRVRQMVCGEMYDTNTSDALSNSFYADGKNAFTDGKAMELYVDRRGRYFFAEYSTYDRVPDRIMPVSEDAAADFVEKYGTKIYKGEPVYPGTRKKVAAG